MYSEQMQRFAKMFELCCSATDDETKEPELCRREIDNDAENKKYGHTQKDENDTHENYKKTGNQQTIKKITRTAHMKNSK